MNHRDTEDTETCLLTTSEVAKPEIIGELKAELGGEIASLRREMLSGFDAVYQRLDRLESERKLQR